MAPFLFPQSFAANYFSTMNFNNLVIWFRSSIQSLLEIFLISLPILIWLVSLRSIGDGHTLSWKSPVTTFFALSLWITVLRDGLRAFHRDTETGDRFQREIVTLYALAGVVLTTVLLAMSVASSVQPDRYILSFHTAFNKIMVVGGGLSAWFIKSILIQRREYQAYYS